MKPTSIGKTRLQILCLVFVVTASATMQAQSSASARISPILEENLTFPSPVQWSTNSVEVSLTHIVWGPAESPEMLSRARKQLDPERPTFLPDRPYVLALGFHARTKDVLPTISYTISGLVRIRDVEGNIEVPMVFTQEGFVPFSGSPGVFDIHFDTNTTTEFWDFFPVSTKENEFLFQVFLANSESNDPKLSFRIVIRDGRATLVDASPYASACRDSSTDFVGTIGSSILVRIHLASNYESLSGTEQYQKIGKTLWLKGNRDSLGNFVLEERYPEDQIAGIFKGKFSDNCTTMQGYFSKPDGSGLLPFEFRELTDAP